MKRLALLAISALLLSGCSNLNGFLDEALGGKEEEAGGASEGRVVEVIESTEVETGIATEGDMGAAETVTNDPVLSPLPQAEVVPLFSGPPQQRLFFFGFDSSAVSPQDLAVIRDHARWLLEHPATLVRIEGHADERGSRQYNIALGERRARTLSDLLVTEGVSTGQLEIISYGEEQPLERGHEEAFWSQNRRVEISYP